MIIVTGAAGFIGSHIIQGLNRLGRTDILAVDDLKRSDKFYNLMSCKFDDYMDSTDFLKEVKNHSSWLNAVETVFHQGSYVNRFEYDGREIMKNNYDYSKVLLHHCIDNKIKFIYASSSSVYGRNQESTEENVEQPIHIVGYSKWLFDQYVNRILLRSESQIVGLRYFDVYGKREHHKGHMASVVHHFCQQLVKQEPLGLYSTSHFSNGQQKRDFIHVDDVVNINLWFWQNPELRGIFNCGTGSAVTFSDIADSLIALNGSGRTHDIPLPLQLIDDYRLHTQANISRLREVGYTDSFKPLVSGLEDVYAWHKSVGVL
jgi:ADP-L-glycero-D-manno-heptose 6-epimerase